MTRSLRLLVCWAIVAVVVLSGSFACAKEHTLDEIKQEILRRVDANEAPFDGLLRGDVNEVLNSLTSLDPDMWGQLWCKPGLAHEARGNELLKKGGDAKEIGREYYVAYGYCHVGRYPAATSPAKRQSYLDAMRMFRKAAQYFDTTLQVVEIPFEGKKIVGYLQIPANVSKPPVVIYWGGVDVWKEDHQRNSRLMHNAGLATFLIDSPGTGESPVLFSDPHAERIFITAMDHLATRTDVDGTRIAVWGRSFGAYWAAKLAYVEPNRLRGAVFHGGNVHFGFQEEWLRPALTETASNYLLGPSSLFDSRSAVLGVKTLDEFLKMAPRFSLKDMGLLDKPSAPILIVNGKLDDQAPIADSYLLLEHGSPKTARIYPEGGHMGAMRGANPDTIVAMIIDWMKDRLTH